MNKKQEFLDIRQALADPDAPWYGSDLVPLVADLCDAAEELLHALRDLSESMETYNFVRNKTARQNAYELLKRFDDV